ncbi:MAG TPA: hypothetical protein VEF04_03985, partial [Blastocatellia bacterium]|nr:hypothetical protein [Blastocatellia bacterium]
MTIAQKASLQLQPDDNVVIHNRSGKIIAHCSLWWTNTPPYQNHKLGLIGHYEANGKSAANALFDQARSHL